MNDFPQPNACHYSLAPTHSLPSRFIHITHYIPIHPQLPTDELESLLSSRFISLDLEGFVSTLDKNKQRDSLSGSSPPNVIGMGRTTSAGARGAVVDNPNPIVADRFILLRELPVSVVCLRSELVRARGRPVSSHHLDLFLSHPRIRIRILLRHS